MWEYSRIEREIVKEHTLTLMGTSMKWNGRMRNRLHRKLTLMEKGNEGDKYVGDWKDGKRA